MRSASLRVIHTPTGMTATPNSRFATTQAWRYARERRFAEHRRWMIRSFAMTFAAVTLRLYLPIAPLLGYDFMDGYRITAWAGWVGNLIVVELWMRRSSPRLQPAE